MITELVMTRDGSHTLFVPELEEHFHSTYGAVNESMHVFIENGFNFIEKNSVSIFEVGFGTGLNAFLTLLRSLQTEKQIYYETIDLYPLELRKAMKLNYSEILGNEDLFHFLHKAGWGRPVSLSPGFVIKKVEADIESFASDEKFDVIYFDAFAPQIQPELWSGEVFERLYTSLNKDGILVTYSSKGEVRRSLADAGFLVDKLPGPTGKREILRALKK